MGKRKKRHDFSARAVLKTPQLPPKPPIKLAKKTPLIILKIIGGVLTFVLSYAGLFSFLPRISVSSGQSLDAHDPFLTSFIIKNDGFLPIDRIEYALLLNHAKTIRVSYTNVLEMVQQDSIPRLLPNDTSTIFITQFNSSVSGGGPVESADISIVIQYHPWPIPFIPLTKKFSFKTFKNSTNEFFWLPFSNSN